MVSLPNYKKLVVAHVEGRAAHSGVDWHREGFGFLVRWPLSVETDQDGWSLRHKKKICEENDMDFIEKIRWCYIDEIKFSDYYVSPSAKEIG